MTPFSNDYVYRFNRLYDFQVLILYLALLNLYLRDPSLERKAGFFLKWFLLLPLQPGYILSVNKLVSLPRNKSANLP